MWHPSAELDQVPTNKLQAELVERRNARAAGCCDYCKRPFHTPPCKFPDRHTPDQPEPILSGVDRIAAERWRQVNVEGFTADLDDARPNNSLIRAAFCYLMSLVVVPVLKLGDQSMPIGGFILSNVWPWHQRWYKPTDYDRTLEKAGALIAAELDRRQRCSSRSTSPASSTPSTPPAP